MIKWIVERYAPGVTIPNDGLIIDTIEKDDVLIIRYSTLPIESDVLIHPLIKLGITSEGNIGSIELTGISQ